MDYIVKNDTIIFSPEYGDEPLNINLLSRYKKVIFSNYELNEDLFDKYESNNLKNLIYIGSIFNNQIANLPNTLTYLTFGKYFNQQVNNLPNTLTYLTFGFYFNHQVDNLPNTLTYLTFSTYFNKPVDNLPNTLTHLTFGIYFNKPVDNLPNTLTHLTFDYYFNQPVDKLPNTLTYLTFCYIFNQPINNLPKTLIHLTFGQKFDKRVDLPLNILYLKLDCNNQYLINNLHNGIEELEFGFNFNLELNNLPSSIKKISFDKYSSYNKELNCLSNFIESITLPKFYDKKILKIPKELKKVICFRAYKFIKDFDNLIVETYF